jgi:hypothetical protein
VPFFFFFFFFFFAIYVRWVRPSYLASRSAPRYPVEGLDRHYYESWLGRAPLIHPQPLPPPPPPPPQPRPLGNGWPEQQRQQLLLHDDGVVLIRRSGCEVAFSISDCGVGKCGQAKWAENRLKKGRKEVYETAMRLMLNKT